MQKDFPMMRPFAMLEKVNALPRSKGQPPVHDRDGHRYRRQRRLYVGRHIVRPLIPVDDIVHRRIVSRRHKPAEERVKVAPYIRVRILLNEQGTGSVAHEKGEQAGSQACILDETRCLRRDLIEPRPARGKGDGFLHRCHGQARQLSRKLLSFRLLLGCFSFLSALASIWRMRSRVTENCWPTSSSV